MAYLISHIALGLVVAQLLGLLLGWLLWGYVARQRGKEIQSLRERLADFQVMSARMTLSPEPRLALADVPGVIAGPMIQGDLPERPPMRRAFFEEEDDEESARLVPSALPEYTPPAFVRQPPVAPDLEAEVRESRLQHLQDQVRELEGVRDRLPLLQADLSNAIAGRKSAETRFQDAKNDFEVRASGLLSQIRDFENAAAEWDSIRDQLEREKIRNEKELTAVKATLRDLQNSQRPQAVLATPVASSVELTDLRERYQKALRERDAATAELDFWKKGDAPAPYDSGRVTDLEETIRNRDSQLTEQAARVESLLWRVAELEPFAAEAPGREEVLRRQESEIAGHMAMHSENAERLRSLQNRIAELEATTVSLDEMQKVLADHQSEIHVISKVHDQQITEARQALSMKDNEIAEHFSARQNQATALDDTRARVAELEASMAKHQSATAANAAEQERQLMEARQASALKDNTIAEHASARQSQANLLEDARTRLADLEKVLSERQTEVRGLLAAHAETQRDVEAWKTHASGLETLAAQVPDLRSSLEAQTLELQRLKESHSDKEGQLTFLQERVGALSSRLTAQQQRVQQLEPLAARTPELEQRLGERERQSNELVQALQERHKNELTRLKTNAAQRTRRLRKLTL